MTPVTVMRRRGKPGNAVGQRNPIHHLGHAVTFANTKIKNCVVDLVGTAAGIASLADRPAGDR